MAERRLTLPAEAGLSGQVADFVAQLAQDSQLPGPQAYWLRLAVDEITTNIADYGYHGGEGVIDLESGTQTSQVWIRIRDDSPPFDPRGHHGDERLNASLAEREEGGYGLLLALAKLDDFDYQNDGGRNCAVLTMNRSQPPDGENDSGKSDQGSNRWTAQEH